MSATSVTGLSGPGSASGHGKGNKGSEHMSIAVHRLIGPRVVMCGDVELDENGDGTVFFPELPGGTDFYCPFLSSDGDTAPTWISFTSTSLGITNGQGGSSACWQVVKKGLWGATSNDGPSEDLTNT